MQLDLPIDGHCNGPLFAPVAKKRPAYRLRRLNGWKWQAQHYRRVTPAWACLWKIKLVYAAARLMGLEVDHIVPLRHPLVCGLHVEHNLRPLDANSNRAKSNNTWPDMWGQQQEIET